MKLLNILLIILCLFSVTYAESLTELQETALSKRKVIERYKANVDRAKKNISIARSGYYPSVDVSYTANNVDADVVTEAEENSVLYGAFTWNLFAGFRDKYNISSAKLLHKVEIHKLKGIRQDIKFDVAQYYLNIFEQQANLQVTEDAYTTLLKAYQDETYRYNMGMINKNDLLSIKVDLDHAELNLKKAKVNLKKSIFSLQRQIDADVQVDTFTFAEFNTLPTSDPLSTVTERMLTNRSDIRVYEDSMNAAEMNVKSAKSAIYPQVKWVSSYQKYDDDYINGNGDADIDETRHQIVVSMNLFDGFGKYNQIDSAKLEAKGLRYDLYELKRDLITELKNTFLDFEVSGENAAVSKESIKQAEENMRITQLSYKEGISNTSDLLNAITNLSRARYNYVAAKKDVFNNYYKILRSEEAF